MKKHKGLKIALLAVGSLFGLLIVFLAGVLIFASATTLKVKNKEEMAVNGEVVTKINKAFTEQADGFEETVAI